MIAFNYFDPDKTLQEIRGAANPAKPANPRPENFNFSNISNFSSYLSRNEAAPEAVEERAAIMEFDAGLSRLKAESKAYEDCKVIWLKEKKSHE